MNRPTNTVYYIVYYFADWNTIRAEVSIDGSNYSLQAKDTVNNCSIYLMFETEKEAIKQATYHFGNFMKNHNLV